MKLPKNYAYAIYWILLVVFLYFFYEKENLFAYTTKFLMIPVLLVHFYLDTSRNHHQLAKSFVLIGLLISYIGDIFITLYSNNLVLVGYLFQGVANIFFGIVLLRAKPLILNKSPQAIIGLVTYVLLVFIVERFVVKNADLSSYLFITVYAISFLPIVVLTANLLLGNRDSFSIYRYLIPAVVLFSFTDLLRLIYQFPAFGEINILKYAATVSSSCAFLLFVAGLKRVLR